MNKIEIALRSPAFWSMVGAILVQILTTIQPQLSGTTSTVVSTILAVLAMYLHPTEVHIAGSTGMLGSKSIR